MKKPREQVADAEALLNIANSLVTSVKALSNDGITASEFVTCLLRDFGQQGGPGSSTQGGRGSIGWKDIGVAVSHIFSSCPGCHTMYCSRITSVSFFFFFFFQEFWVIIHLSLFLF